MISENSVNTINTGSSNLRIATTISDSNGFYNDI